MSWARMGEALLGHISASAQPIITDTSLNVAKTFWFGASGPPHAFNRAILLEVKNAEAIFRSNTLNTAQVVLPLWEYMDIDYDDDDMMQDEQDLDVLPAHLSLSADHRIRKVILGSKIYMIQIHIL